MCVLVFILLMIWPCLVSIQVLLVRDMGQQKFVNVDMSSQEGLERAKALNLASSSVPDIVISDILQGTLEVFNNSEYKCCTGMCFCCRLSFYLTIMIVLPRKSSSHVRCI